MGWNGVDGCDDGRMRRVLFGGLAEAVYGLVFGCALCYRCIAYFRYKKRRRLMLLWCVLDKI